MSFDFLRSILRKENENKKVVYTIITENYDKLLNPEYINKDWDYICFTDNENLKSKLWQIRKLKHDNLDRVRKQRRCKILPHEYLSEYDYSLYIDGNFKIIKNVDNFIDKYSNNNKMLCFIHPDRNCIYEESKVCIDAKKDFKKVIDTQIEKYKSYNYPKKQGLIASGILFRKHNDPLVIKVMESWWNEVKFHSIRDQLSFNYCCWKNSFEYEECDLSYWGNEYFKRSPHNHELNEK